VRRAPGSLVSRYAKSLFAAARERGVLDEVRRDVAALSEAWRDYPEVGLLVTNPRLSRKKVHDILMSLADRLQVHDITRRFLDVLMEKDRLIVLSDVGPRFEQLWRDHEGEINVSVRTAVPVGDELRRAIHDHLAARSGRRPQIAWDCDPALLGGVVIEFPDRVFDGSLARKLANLKDHLAWAALATADR